MTVPDVHVNKKIQDRIVVNSSFQGICSNWRHEWFKICNKSYAEVVKNTTDRNKVHRECLSNERRVSKRLSDCSVLPHKNAVKNVSSNEKYFLQQNKVDSVSYNGTRCRNNIVHSVVQNKTDERNDSGKCQIRSFHHVNTGTKRPTYRVGRPENSAQVQCINRFAPLNDLSGVDSHNVHTLNVNAKSFVPFKSIDIEQKHKRNDMDTRSTNKNIPEKIESGKKSEHGKKSQNTDISTVESKNSKNSVRLDTDDKYALPLLMKEKQSEILKIASGNPTFERLKVQNDQKFGYIPLANQKIPIYNRNRFLDLDPIQLHNKMKKSNIPNFLGEQIRVKTELRVENWEKYAADYWDKQLIFLIKYGFPLDFDDTNPLRSTEINHFSARQHNSHVENYIQEEISHGAILGPFEEKPIENLHISPFYPGKNKILTIGGS